MSRSYRKPYGTWCGKDRKDKIITNRIMRRKVKNLLLNNDPDILPEKKKEVRDIWSYSQDGGQQLIHNDPYLTKAKRK